MIARLCSWLMVGPAGLKLNPAPMVLVWLTCLKLERSSAAPCAGLANLLGWGAGL